MPPNEITLRTAIKRVLAEWRTGTPYLVLSFHRVADADPGNPFRHLDTISPDSFRTTMRLARSVFDVVPYSELVANARRGRRPRLALTFDDLSRTFLTTALPILEELELPVTLFPCVQHADQGVAWRDLVYYLLDHAELAPAVEHRVEAVLGAEAVQQLRTDGLYRWTKRLDPGTARLEREVLRPVLGAHEAAFAALVARFRPYMSWADLARVASHPLITIGSHGNIHHDYRGLSNAEIRRDVTLAHEQVFHKLGFHPQHFALPFGGVDQRVWQTLDNLLPGLGVKTASWCAPYGNASPRENAPLLHISRINASAAIARTVRDCVKALARPISNYATTFSNARLAGQGEFDANITEAEYRNFYALVLPQKRIHQMPAYYDYLFKSPYRDPQKPAHLGLRYEGNVEALVSLFWSPFAIRGTPIDGPYISGWWRLPQIHSQVGTKPFLPLAREHAEVLAGYKTSKDTRRLFERDGWSFVDLSRYEGRLTKLAPHTAYQVAETYPPEIDALLDATNQAVSLSIYRDRRYYTWRFDRYPLLKYVYLYDAKPVRRWLAMVASDGRNLYLSDVIARPLTSEDAWHELLGAVADYQRTTTARHIVLETNNPALRRVCAASGLTATASFINTYYLSPALRARVGEISLEHGTHETMATGDKLPEVKLRPHRFHLAGLRP
jgi:peptidoglycan/xylan/chitin deacetylase (PgdA/CDA1 family)